MIHRFATATDATTAFADTLIGRIARQPRIVLGLATGATMEPVYARLVDAHKRGAITFSGVTSFNLDDYIGLVPDDPQAYRATMQRQLFDHVDIDIARTHVPDGMAADPAAEALAYEQAIAAAGGIDVQILGIGQNGHIGFNEPGSAFDARTHRVALHASTLAANARFFDGRLPPTEALTMGIATILSARDIMVLANGRAKRDAVARAISQGQDPDCPASALQRHASVGWWLDRDAASGLED